MRSSSCGEVGRGHTASPVSKGTHMRLLVVEDEPRIFELIKAALERAEFVVDTVRVRADAREALANVAYDAAILDLGLPDGDGLDLLAELRSRWKPRTDLDPHRTRCGGASGSRARCRGGRLPGQTVCDERAHRSDQSPVAPSRCGARCLAQGRQHRIRHDWARLKRCRCPAATPSP